jgi:histidinol dehydrogenase
VSVETFIKRSSIIALSRDALRNLAPDILALADEEGFEAHAAAVHIRLHEENDANA